MILLFCFGHAQTYYGEKLFGRLEMINDSVCTIAFISMGDYYPVDSCCVRKHGDTVFLSTKKQWRYKVNIFDKQQTVDNPWYCSIIKIYRYSFPNKYEYITDVVGAYDSTTRSIVVEEIVFGRGHYILVYKDIFTYYRVKCSFDKERNFVVLEENPDYTNEIIFNEFPLLVKGNKLIPIDKEKQMQCWLDNGFFFPKMKMSKKTKKYKIINGHYIGLRNLPTKMESLEKLEPLQITPQNQNKRVEYLDKCWNRVR
jgi:hypothetical protein